MFELAIFDFDGTLCVTHEAIQACLGDTLESFGFQRPAPDRTMATIRRGIGLSETLGSLLPEGHGADVDDMVLSYRERYNGGLAARLTHPFEGAVACLGTLADAGVRVVVMSNKGEVAVRDAIERWGFAAHVDLVLGEAPGVAKKPDPATYHQRIRPTFPGIAPGATIMVGDTAADILYARNIGATSCWARYGYGDHAMCPALNPDVTVDDFQQLVETILGPGAPAS